MTRLSFILVVFSFSFFYLQPDPVSAATGSMMVENPISDEGGLAVPSPFKPAHIVFAHQQNGAGTERDDPVVSQSDFLWGVHRQTIETGFLGDAAKAVGLCARQQQALTVSADQYFPLEEWTCCLSIVDRLKRERVDQGFQGQIIDIILKRRASVTHKGRGMAMFYGELFSKTNHHKVGLACVSYYTERYTGDYEGRRYLDDGDIDTLVRMIKPESPVRAEAYELVEELKDTGPVNHSRKIRLYEGLIRYAPDAEIRGSQLDELRYYYVDFLRVRYLFRQEDTNLLKRIAIDPENAVYASSFKALQIYSSERDVRYLIDLKYRAQIEIRKIIAKGRSLEEFGTILRFGRIARGCEILQKLIDDCLAYVKDRRDITLEHLEYLQIFSEIEPILGSQKNLPLLSGFLRQWYSV